MLKVLSNILCDLDPKVKVIGRKAGICDGVPSTSALVLFDFTSQSTIFQLCRDGSSCVEYQLIKITGPDTIKNGEFS